MVSDYVVLDTPLAVLPNSSQCLQPADCASDELRTRSWIPQPCQGVPSFPWQWGLSDKLFPGPLVKMFANDRFHHLQQNSGTFWSDHPGRQGCFASAQPVKRVEVKIQITAKYWNEWNVAPFILKRASCFLKYLLCYANGIKREWIFNVPQLLHDDIFTIPIVHAQVVESSFSS